MSEPTKRRRGRPSKGKREPIRGDVPVALAKRFKADADQLQMSDADYLTPVLEKFYQPEQEDAAA